MATSKAVPPWGGTGRGGWALGPEDWSKSTLLFSSRREGGERQERRWGAGASWYSWAGGHNCGRERALINLSSDGHSIRKMRLITAKMSYYRVSLWGKHYWTQESQALPDWSWELSHSLQSFLHCPRSLTAEEWRLTDNHVGTNCWNFECNLVEN